MLINKIFAQKAISILGFCMLAVVLNILKDFKQQSILHFSLKTRYAHTHTAYKTFVRMWQKVARITACCSRLTNQVDHCYDICCRTPSDPSHRYIKRIIALEGDTVMYVSNCVLFYLCYVYILLYVCQTKYRLSILKYSLVQFI